MVVMDSKNLKEREIFIDLESGINATISEQEGPSSDDYSIKQEKKLLDTVWSGFDGLGKSGEDADSIDNFSSFMDRPFENEKSLADKRFGGEENVGLLEKKAVTERLREKARRKPPKPPRPPKSPLLNAADRKLVQEISELATLKRARIERMKALKKMKNTKATSSSSNFCALVITILFCAIIIWQGVFSKSSSSGRFHGSPESSLILAQFQRNLSNGPLRSSFVERVSGVDGHGGASKVAG